MKQVIIFLSFYLLGNIFAGKLEAQTQASRFVTGKVIHTQTGSDATTFTVSCNFTDEGGLYDGTNVAVNDYLFVSDGGYGYYLPISVVVTPGPVTVVVKVLKTGIALGAIPTGVGYISRGTRYLEAFPFVSGISNADQQIAMENTLHMLDSLLQYRLPARTTGGTPPGYTPTGNDSWIAQNGSGEVYKYNGSTWSGIGSSGNACRDTITQTAHGFVFTNIKPVIPVYNNGGIWTLATGTSTTVAPSNIIVQIIDANTLVLGWCGIVDRTNTLTTNNYYFLDNTGAFISSVSGVNYPHRLIHVVGSTIYLHPEGLYYSPGTVNVSTPVNGDGTVANPLTIGSNSINDTHIATGAITTSEILNGTILTEDLTNSIIDSTKLAANSVQSSDIIDGGVWLADLASNSVDSTKLRLSSVQSSDINNGQVWKVDLAANSVDSTKISNRGISVFDIAANGATNGQVLKWNTNMWIPSADNSGVPALTNGNIFVGNVSNVATDVAVTGDITITNAGVVEVNSAKDFLSFTDVFNDAAGGDRSNWVVTASRVNVAPTLDILVHGISASGGNSSKIVYVTNTSATFNVTIKNNSATASLANRFDIGEDFVIAPKKSAAFIYTASFWRIMGLTSGGGSGVSDGDKTDIDVTGSGSVWTVDTASITTIKIAANAIDSTKVAAAAIQSSDIGTAAVWKINIASNAIDSVKLAINSVQSSDITDGQIWKTDLASNSVDSNKISNRGISVFDIGSNGASNGFGLYWNGNMWLPRILAVADIPTTGGDVSGLINNIQLGTGVVTATELAVGAVDLSTSDVTGILPAARFGALTGDVTNTAGSYATTIADNSVDGTDIALGSDANGDIMYYNGTDWVRRAAGTNTHVLTLTGGIPTWAAPSSGADGNGIFTGDGNIPNGTQATLVDNGLFDIEWFGGNDAISIDDNGEQMLFKSKDGTKIIQFNNSGVELNGGGTLINVGATEAKLAGETIIYDIVGPTIDPDAVLDVQSTTKLLYPPRMTTTERNAISTGGLNNGGLLYNITTGRFTGRDGTGWVEFSAGGADNWGTDVVNHGTTLTGNGTVGTPLDVATNGITNTQMADNAIGNAELIDDAVNTAEINDNAITNVLMADNSIGNAEMLDNAIGAAEMADNAIGTNEITNGTVALIDQANMATASLVYRKTAGAGAPEINTLATLKTDLGLVGNNNGDVTLAGETYLGIAGQVITANSVNLSGTHATGTLNAARFGALTGDVTNSAGSYATTIANNAITNAKMADNAIASAEISDGTIALADMAANSIDSTKLVVGAVMSTDITNGQVWTIDLADNAVTNVKVADNAIGNAELADNAVNTVELANNSVTGTKIALGFDAAGDVMYYNGTDYERIPVGSNGHVFTLTAGIPGWAAPGGSSGYNAIQEEGGSSLPARQILNFVGSSYTATDNGSTKTLITADSDLDAIASNTTDGIYVRTGAGTIATRTITGTANKITVLDGDGVDDNPLIGVGTDIVQLTLTQTLTNKTIALGSNTISGTTAQFNTANTDGDFVTLDNAVVITNKEITPRISTTASSSTPTPVESTDDMFTVTALAANATFGDPGAGTNGQPLLVRIKDNGTARTLAWNAVYRAGTEIPLPTTTVISKTIYCTFIYNTADSKWDLVGRATGL